MHYVSPDSSCIQSLKLQSFSVLLVLHVFLLMLIETKVVSGEMKLGICLAKVKVQDSKKLFKGSLLQVCRLCISRIPLPS